MFDPSTRSGIITPFGSLVEPLVYCRITSRSGSGGGDLDRIGAAVAAAHDGGHRHERRVARRRLVERGQQIVDQHDLCPPMTDAGAGRLDEHLERAHAHRQRQHHARRADQPAALDDRDQRPARRPEDGDVVARHDAARLQRGADGSGLVVQLRPRDRRVAVRGDDGRTDEMNTGRPISGCLQALRDRCWMWHFPRLSHAHGAATTVAP